MAPGRKDDVYEVKEILKMRKKDGVEEYFVSWVGYDEDDNSWVPAENLNCPDLIEAFGKSQGTSKTPAKIPKKTTKTPTTTPLKKTTETPRKSTRKTPLKESKLPPASSSTRKVTKRIHQIEEADEEHETPRKIPKDTIALLHEQKKKATPGKSIIHHVQRTFETQDDDEDDEEEEEQAASGGSGCVIL